MSNGKTDNKVNTPSKHETLTQCWFNSGPPSATLAQHTTTLVQRLLFAGLRVWQCKPTPTQCLLNVRPASPVLANRSIHKTVVSRPTSCWLYYQLMLARRLWRWPTFSLASNRHGNPTQYWANVGSALWKVGQQ